MHSSRKPVRKCHGCGLSFIDHCGVFESPHDMWHSHRTCPGYKNEAMLQAYLARTAREQTNPRKEKRRQVAKLRATRPRVSVDRHVTMSVRP